MLFLVKHASTSLLCSEQLSLLLLHPVAPVGRLLTNIQKPCKVKNSMCWQALSLASESDNDLCGLKWTRTREPRNVRSLLRLMCFEVLCCFLFYCIRPIMGLFWDMTRPSLRSAESPGYAAIVTRISASSHRGEVMSAVLSYYRSSPACIATSSARDT